MTLTPPRPATQSLNDVRAVIPPSCYQPSTRRAVLALIQSAVLYLAPLVGLVLLDRWWAVPILWVLAGLGIAGLFVLGHDASHSALFESRRANQIVANVLMAPSAHIESAWDLGHNRVHHGFTTRQGYDFVWHPTTVDEYRELGWFARLAHRIEWSWLGSGFYYARVVWLQKMWLFKGGGKHAATIRRDRRRLGLIWLVAIAGVATAGALTGGWLAAVWLPVKVLIVPTLVFMHIIGWTVYVHHVGRDIRWWPKREWSQFRGQMESTTILRLPRLVNALWFHNIFVHVPHHVDARIPFHQLPAAAAAIEAAFPGTVRTLGWSWREYAAGVRNCKLYDFDAGRWHRYAAARPDAAAA